MSCRREALQSLASVYDSHRYARFIFNVNKLWDKLELLLPFVFVWAKPEANIEFLPVKNGNFKDLININA